MSRSWRAGFSKFVTTDHSQADSWLYPRPKAGETAPLSPESCPLHAQPSAEGGEEPTETVPYDTWAERSGRPSVPSLDDVRREGAREAAGEVGEIAVELGAGTLGLVPGAIATLLGPIGRLVGRAARPELRRRDLQLRRAELSVETSRAVHSRAVGLAIVRPAWPHRGLVVAHFAVDECDMSPSAPLDVLESPDRHRISMRLHLLRSRAELDSPIGLLRLLTEQEDNR